MPLLAWPALTGDSRKTDVVTPLVKPAELKGYAASLCLVTKTIMRSDETSIVDGLLVQV